MNLNIGNVNVSVNSNSKYQLNDIITPSSHSLHTNWSYQNVNGGDNYKVDIIDGTKEKIQVILDQNYLSVIGNFSFSTNQGFNPQFGIGGNKGIISKYISHINEFNNVISLHACALIHPITGRIILGIGTSGGGKTALISNGLLQGWKIIGTEMVQIDGDGNILKGNNYDTIGKNAEVFFNNHSNLKVDVKTEDKIFDQTGAKCLADFGQYMYNGGQINIKDCEIVFLQYGDDNFNNGTIVTDNDMALRFLMHSASEKIESPTYVGNDILNINMYGNINFRNKMVHLILDNVARKKILGGNMENFLSYLK